MKIYHEVESIRDLTVNWPDAEKPLVKKLGSNLKDVLLIGIAHTVRTSFLSYQNTAMAVGRGVERFKEVRSLVKNISFDD